MMVSPLGGHWLCWNLRCVHHNKLVYGSSCLHCGCQQHEADWPCPNPACSNHTKKVFGKLSFCPLCKTAKGHQFYQSQGVNLKRAVPAEKRAVAVPAAAEGVTALVAAEKLGAESVVSGIVASGIGLVRAKLVGEKLEAEASISRELLALEELIHIEYINHEGRLATLLAKHRDDVCKALRLAATASQLQAQNQVTVARPSAPQATLKQVKMQIVATTEEDPLVEADAAMGAVLGKARCNSGEHRLNEIRSRYDEQECRANNTMLLKTVQNLFSALGVEKKSLDRMRCKRVLPDTALHRFVEGQCFQMLLNFVILANIVFLGVSINEDVGRSIEHLESGSDAKLASPPRIFVGDIIFCCLFFSEFVIKQIVYEFEYWTGPHCVQNILDFITLVAYTIQVFVANRSHAGWQLLFVVIVRLARAIRIIDALSELKSLRLMLLASLQSLSPLFWALMFMSTITFVSAMIILQSLTVYIDLGSASGEKASYAVQNYFRDLPRAALYLFMSIAGGIDWSVIQEALLDVSLYMGALYLFYIALMQFCVCSIVIAIFVERAMEMARKDREIAMQVEIDRAQQHHKKLRHLFQELDSNNTGMITFDEFKLCAKRPEYQALFRSLGLDVSSPEDTFHLLDVNDNLYVEIEEFVIGCTGLKDKFVDIQTFVRENRGLHRQQATLHKQLLYALEELLSRVQSQSSTQVDASANAPRRLQPQLTNQSLDLSGEAFEERRVRRLHSDKAVMPE